MVLKFFFSEVEKNPGTGFRLQQEGSYEKDTAVSPPLHCLSTAISCQKSTPIFGFKKMLRGVTYKVWLQLSAKRLRYKFQIVGGSSGEGSNVQRLKGHSFGLGFRV